MAIYAYVVVQLLHSAHFRISINCPGLNCHSLLNSCFEGDKSKAVCPLCDILRVCFPDQPAFFLFFFFFEKKGKHRERWTFLFWGESVDRTELQIDLCTPWSLWYATSPQLLMVTMWVTFAILVTYACAILTQAVKQKRSSSSFLLPSPGPQKRERERKKGLA